MQEDDDEKLGMAIAYGLIFGMGIGLLVGISIDQVGWGIALGPAFGMLIAIVVNQLRGRQ